MWPRAANPSIGSSGSSRSSCPVAQFTKRTKTSGDEPAHGPSRDDSGCIRDTVSRCPRRMRNSSTVSGANLQVNPGGRRLSIRAGLAVRDSVHDDSILCRLTLGISGGAKRRPLHAVVGRPSRFYRNWLKVLSNFIVASYSRRSPSKSHL